MADRAGIRSTIKTLAGRNFAGIDNILNTLIDSAVELFGSTISTVYDEEEWERQITQADVNAKIDNYQLPGRTKFILKATIIDKSGTENVYHELEQLSPVDWYELQRLEGASISSRPQEDYSTTITYGGYKLRSYFTGRVDRTGIPKYFARIGTNIFLYPRPSNSEVGWFLRLLLAVKPAKLTSDTTSNSITDNYSDALIYYAGALLWLLHLNDQVRGQQWLQTASLYLQTFATEEELKKLMGITLKMR